jgi:glycosyltransferase involved in cell wall biosynthesis
VKVSVATPSCNQGAFNEQTLRSVALQEGAQVEHLVFDGGSTDGTVAILESFGPAVPTTSTARAGASGISRKSSPAHGFTPRTRRWARAWRCTPKSTT